MFGAGGGADSHGTPFSGGCEPSKEPLRASGGLSRAELKVRGKWQLQACKSAPLNANNVLFLPLMSPFSPSWKGPSTGREAFDVIHWKLDAGAEAFCSRPGPFISAKRHPLTSPAHLEDRSFTTATLESAVEGNQMVLLLLILIKLARSRVASWRRRGVGAHGAGWGRCGEAGMSQWNRLCKYIHL